MIQTPFVLLAVLQITLSDSLILSLKLRLSLKNMELVATQTAALEVTSCLSPRRLASPYLMIMTSKCQVSLQFQAIHTNIAMVPKGSLA